MGWWAGGRVVEVATGRYGACGDRAVDMNLDEPMRRSDADGGFLFGFAFM